MKTVFFTLAELIRTDTDLPNTPSFEQIDWLYKLVTTVLDPARAAFKRPIKVNSGYRSPAVNAAVGGAKNSQHLCLNGCAAADITAGDKINNKILFDLIIKLGLPFDQIISEKDYTWIHVSHSTLNNRGQILFM